MRKIIALAISFLILTSLAISAHAVGSVPEKVIRATESVVRILSKYSDGYATGTGFVIKSDKNETLIITNHHVVEDNPYSISVWVNDGELINAEILAATSQKDICILRLTQQISLKTVSLSQASAKQGDAVYAVGFPAAADILSDTEAHTSQDATITDGIVSARREVTTTQFGTPVEILQISAAINSGNSGGPLFDLNGKVVGVNTYGIADAQGIFGAIDISEIHRFLDENGVSVKSDFKVIALIALVAGIALIAIGCIIVFSRKKKVSKSKSKKKNTTTLRNFMVAYPNGLGIHDAVALLLPVALQLRDMHNNGQPHLQVSPDSIIVGTTAKLVAPTGSESDRYISGFAPKEIYSGSGRGILSDVYSFCAVLYYASFGTIPVNSLQRNVEDIYTCEDSSFADIINQGMHIQPENRFDTMQSLILKLSEYNVKPFSPQTDAVQSTPVHQKGLTKKIKVSIVFSSILVILVLGYWGIFFAVNYCVEAGNYSVAAKLLQVPTMAKWYDEQLLTYIDAGTLMNNRQYKEAKELYTSLSGFLDADTMVLEADYYHAAQLADVNDFDAAFQKFQLLAKDNYKDSREKVKEVGYRRGLYIMYEEQDYLTAYNYLKSSLYDEIDGISDVRNELKELLYTEGILLYRSGEFEEASKRFIDGYKDSDNYKFLMSVYRSFHMGSNKDEERDTNRLIELFYFENAAEIILYNNDIAQRFLHGTWKSTSGNKYFKYDFHSYSVSFNLPWFNYGDFFESFKNGQMVAYYSRDDYETPITLFSFVALTPNQIQVYCHKDGSTYILNRQ